MRSVRRPANGFFQRHTTVAEIGVWLALAALLILLCGAATFGSRIERPAVSGPHASQDQSSAGFVSRNAAAAGNSETSTDQG
jgi:hypothetical protein